jgi:hypothetical protein
MVVFDVRKEDKSKKVGYKFEGDLSQIPYQSKLVKWRTIETELVVNIKA